MEVFGKEWKDHPQKISTHWKKQVSSEDLVLLAGDISWAKSVRLALYDLEWIDALPGTKVMIKGNHDPWWPSYKKLTEALATLPNQSIYPIYNNAFNREGLSIGGSRLWDSDAYHYHHCIAFKENPYAKAVDNSKDGDKKIFDREISRLRLSLSQMDPEARLKIVMTHYPPVGHLQSRSEVAEMFHHYGIDIALFGHLHSLKEGVSLDWEGEGCRYICTSADYLNFQLIKVADIEDDSI